MSFPNLSRDRGKPSGHSLAMIQIQMFAELFEGASEAQARGYLGRIGARLAALSPLPRDAESGEALTGAMNLLWADLEWGKAEIALDEKGIDIVHLGMPLALDGDDEGVWKNGILWILEGAYDAWFRAMGSGPGLSTRVVGQSAGRIELRHGA